MTKLRLAAFNKRKKSVHQKRSGIDFNTTFKIEINFIMVSELIQNRLNEDLYCIKSEHLMYASLVFQCKVEMDKC